MRPQRSAGYRGRPVRVDPDVDLRLPADRSELAPNPWPVLLAVSAGGAAGAVCRWTVEAAIPHGSGEFPWPTFGVNVTGSLLIGALMVVLTRIWPGRRLPRPLFGVGFLGGFTTFSTYVVDFWRVASAGSPPVAVAYLVGTPLAALSAVWLGTAIASWVVDCLRRNRAKGRPWILR